MFAIRLGHSSAPDVDLMGHWFDVGGVHAASVESADNVET